jgi:hypothetical protein
MRLKTAALAIGLALVAVACVPPKPPAGTPLPDLAMPQIGGLAVSNPGGGVHALRFDATVVNIGDADFRISAARPDTASAWKVSQSLPNSQGGLTAYETTAGYVYGGDGHNHWHLRNLLTYKLYALPDVTFLRQSLKSGFCFFDTTPWNLSLPRAPQSPVYNSLDCGAQSATTSSMGLSIGWGDTYPKGLFGQEIDITGLAAGDYRVQVIADEDARYYEKTRANNTNWTDFRLSYLSDGRARIAILATGPQP